MKLNLIDKAFILKKTLIFGALDLELLLTISNHLEIVNHKKSEKIFQSDQQSRYTYLIVNGKVLIEDKRGNYLAELDSGEFFGDESLFNEKPRAYEAISKTPLTLLTLSYSHLISIINECPTVAIALLKAYNQHIDFRKR
ncbi:MAG: cyclic nucleotide-binding domain-containing protein [Chlamydiales bacterium]